MREWKAIRRRCRNCGTIMTGYRDSKGKVTTVCSGCGAKAISWIINRRCERCDTDAPIGQEIAEEN